MFRSLVGDRKKTAPEEEIDKTDAKENSSKVPVNPLSLHDFVPRLLTLP